MKHPKLKRGATPLCQLVTQREGCVVGETVLFEGSIHSFQVAGEDGDEVRIGECYLGLTRAQTEALRRFMKDECLRINERERYEPGGLEAEFISYG